MGVVILVRLYICEFWVKIKCMKTGGIYWNLSVQMLVDIFSTALSLYLPKLLHKILVSSYWWWYVPKLINIIIYRWHLFWYISYLILNIYPTKPGSMLLTYNFNDPCRRLWHLIQEFRTDCFFICFWKSWFVTLISRLGYVRLLAPQE